MSKDHEQVHLCVKQSLPPEDDNEFDKPHEPEENACHCHLAFNIYVLVSLFIVAHWNADFDMLGTRLVDDGHSDHLEDQTDEFGLL